MEEFEVLFDRSAVVRTGGNTLGLERAIRKEISELFENGLRSIDRLTFHTVFYPDRSTPFVCSPIRAQERWAIFVEAARYERHPQPLEEGPFAGKHVEFPVPHRDGDE